MTVAGTVGIGDEIRADDPQALAGPPDDVGKGDRAFFELVGRPNTHHQHRLIAGRLDIGRWRREQGLAGCPFLVFAKQQRTAQRGRAEDPHMGIAPAPDSKVLTQILHTHIVPTNPGLLAISHDDLAVIEVVDPGRAVKAQEFVALVAVGYLDPCRAPFGPVAPGRAGTADIVIIAG